MFIPPGMTAESAMEAALEMEEKIKSDPDFSNIYKHHMQRYLEMAAFLEKRKQA